MDFLILKVSLNSAAVCVLYFSMIRRFLKRIPLRDLLHGGSCKNSSPESIGESGELSDDDDEVESSELEEDSEESSELEDEPSELGDETETDDVFESGLDI